MLGTRVELDEASVCERLASAAGKLESEVAFVRARFESGVVDLLLGGGLFWRFEEGSGEALFFGASEVSACDSGVRTGASVSGSSFAGFQGLRIGNFSSRHHRRMRVAVCGVDVFTSVKP